MTTLEHDASTDGQQTFLLVDPADPGLIYCLGAVMRQDIITVCLDPHTGQPAFDRHPSIQDALTDIRRILGGHRPLRLVKGGPSNNAGLESAYEEIVLVKAVRRSQRDVVGVPTVAKEVDSP